VISLSWGRGDGVFVAVPVTFFSSSKRWVLIKEEGGRKEGGGSTFYGAGIGKKGLLHGASVLGGEKRDESIWPSLEAVSNSPSAVAAGRKKGGERGNSATGLMCSPWRRI